MTRSKSKLIKVVCMFYDKNMSKFCYLKLLIHDFCSKFTSTINAVKKELKAHEQQLTEIQTSINFQQTPSNQVLEEAV